MYVHVHVLLHFIYINWLSLYEIQHCNIFYNIFFPICFNQPHDFYLSFSFLLRGQIRYIILLKFKIINYFQGDSLVCFSNYEFYFLLSYWIFFFFFYRFIRMGYWWIIEFTKMRFFCSVGLKYVERSSGNGFLGLWHCQGPFP